MAFESSLAFGIYSQTKHFLQGNPESGKPQLLAILPSGAFAGGFISFILCPSELVKCRMQVQGADSILQSSSRYRSPVDCALKTVKSEGLTGLFRRAGATFFRESIGNAVFFSTYEYVRYYMHKPLRDASSDLTHVIDVGVGIVSGGLGGIACWSAVLPLDVAKTIIQTSTEKNHTRNPVKILELIYRRSGIRGCYTGLGPTIVRAFPANASAIVTWELAMKILGIKRD
ncbi:mitochondrial arginine transporter BAC1-like [Salvia splendens]|nr:mitochondrial arginine transporter BAC1-like [Salvia splendens]XP_042028128.1 mitochondrial arginine transporter BAC1-like [Salvia splendens]XP_042028129.1 mitochondrial arginine transporter BAC1-like [Salvia splendens]XP_042028131.1 mitochondrial arginine transporter BAC1-like [Salvia splendens]XP_042028132.1 mitochondrial arginine transporter BAC1-like [Salvia splendens]XP_042028133.1 mitochondrial arginine transporter BAC1-like [Salvia splendens]XP_042028134.1 mitochondrial arginine tra